MKNKLLALIAALAIFSGLGALAHAQTGPTEINVGSTNFKLKAPENYIWVDRNMQLELYLVPQRYKPLLDHLKSSYRLSGFQPRMPFDKYMALFVIGSDHQNWTPDEFTALQNKLKPLVKGQSSLEPASPQDIKRVKELTGKVTSMTFTEGELALIAQRLAQGNFQEFALGDSFILQMPVDGPPDDLTLVEINVKLINGKLLGFIYYQPVHEWDLDSVSVDKLRNWRAEVVKANHKK